MEEKELKKSKKKYRIIIVLVLLLIVSLILIVIAVNNKMIFGGKLVNDLEIEKVQEEKQKNEAINTAQNELEKLGEIISNDDLDVIKIQRKGEFYYYISARENTIEVRIRDNKITRINSVPVK